MITHRGRQVVGVRYDLVYDGEVMETYDTQGSGRISEIIAKADRNPGMTVIAECYREPEEETGLEVVLSRRQVYPVPSAA